MATIFQILAGSCDTVEPADLVLEVRANMVLSAQDLIDRVHDSSSCYGGRAMDDEEVVNDAQLGEEAS
jgi:hypothetical protein